jgi:mono/diheme cytochrome c family protein
MSTSLSTFKPQESTFMRSGTKATIAVGLLLAAGLGYLGVSIVRHGFSAREIPSQLEEFLARHARNIAAPAGAKELKNPYSVTTESLSAARAHWVSQCAICHGLEGAGKTPVGRNLYPEAPDMRDPFTQGLSDGELFYIINNGVRFTGMPAWGRRAHSGGDLAASLVHPAVTTVDPG